MPAPNTPQDLIDRIRTLERAVESLNGRVNIRPALNTIVGGSVTIKEGGQLLVEDVDGTDVFTVGRVSPDVDGQPQQATVVRRMDGSLAFAVWTSATTGIQPVRMYDHNSNIIFADDTASGGGGLAIPWLPLPTPQPNASADWPSTTATTMTEIAFCRAYLHHPRLQIHAVGAATGGTGQLRIDIDGVTVATSALAASPSIDTFVDVPSWAWTGVPQLKTISLKAMRGTGTAMAATVRSIYGRQS